MSSTSSRAQRAWRCEKAGPHGDLIRMGKARAQFEENARVSQVCGFSFEPQLRPTILFGDLSEPDAA